MDADIITWFNFHPLRLMGDNNQFSPVQYSLPRVTEYNYRCVGAKAMKESWEWILENWRKGSWKPSFLKSRLFIIVVEQWLKRYLVTPDERNCPCSVKSMTDWAYAVVHWTSIWKGGSAAILEFKCSRIAKMEAMGLKDDFSTDKALFSVDYLLEFRDDVVYAEKMPFRLKSHLFSPKSRLFGPWKSNLSAEKAPFQFSTFFWEFASGIKKVFQSS